MGGAAVAAGVSEFGVAEALHAKGRFSGLMCNFPRAEVEAT